MQADSKHAKSTCTQAHTHMAQGPTPTTRHAHAGPLLHQDTHTTCASKQLPNTDTACRSCSSQVTTPITYTHHTTSKHTIIGQHSAEHTNASQHPALLSAQFRSLDSAAARCRAWLAAVRWPLPLLQLPPPPPPLRRSSKKLNTCFSEPRVGRAAG